MGKKAKNKKPDTQPAAGTKYPPATAPQLERLRALLLELERFLDSAHPDAGAVFKAMRALSWTGYPVPPEWRMEAWQDVSFPRDDRMVYYILAGMNVADVEAMIQAAESQPTPAVRARRGLRRGAISDRVITEAARDPHASYAKLAERAGTSEGYVKKLRRPITSAREKAREREERNRVPSMGDDSSAPDLLDAGGTGRVTRKP